MQSPHPCIALVETVYSHLTPTTHFTGEVLTAFAGGGKPSSAHQGGKTGTKRIVPAHG